MLSLMSENAVEQAPYLIYKGKFHPLVYYNFSVPVTKEN